MGNFCSTEQKKQNNNKQIKLLIKNNELEKEMINLKNEIKKLENIIKEKNTTEENTVNEKRNRSPINRNGLEQYIDKLLSDPNTNISFLPDIVEKKLYQNILTLILNIMDNTLEHTNIQFLGQTLKIDIQ